MILDDVGQHLPEAGSFERAAAAPGMFLASCANMGLVSEALHERAETAIVRLKYRGITGGGFLVASCGGNLDTAYLSETGRTLAARCYPEFLVKAAELVGGDVEDKWPHYDCVAPWLTGRYLGAISSAKGRRWWKFWK